MKNVLNNLMALVECGNIFDCNHRDVDFKNQQGMLCFC